MVLSDLRSSCRGSGRQRNALAWRDPSLSFLHSKLSSTNPVRMEWRMLLWACHTGRGTKYWIMYFKWGSTSGYICRGHWNVWIVSPSEVVWMCLLMWSVRSWSRSSASLIQSWKLQMRWSSLKPPSFPSADVSLSQFNSLNSLEKSRSVCKLWNICFVRPKVPSQQFYHKNYGYLTWFWSHGSKYWQGFPTFADKVITIR